jgi:hypothetical protein
MIQSDEQLHLGFQPTRALFIEPDRLCSFH